MPGDGRVARFRAPSASEDEPYLAYAVSLSLPVWVYWARIMRWMHVEKTLSVPGMRAPRAVLLPPVQPAQLASITSFL